MAYSTISKPSLHFNTKLYTGNASTNAITGVGFQPDWVWIKCRSVNHIHLLFDSIRGTTNYLRTNGTNAEATASATLTAFDSDGFTLGNDDGVNQNTATFASWNWLAGGSASSNTDGSITSNVSANTTSGFSIVSYTGTGSALTVGHGLGVKPSMIIAKSTTIANNWIVQHGSLGATNTIFLDNTNPSQTGTVFWNDTEPTSSVFSLGNWSGINTSGSGIIAYCFAEKKGYSKFGSYTGNGNADGTFVYTGFKPSWVMVKRTDATQGWYMLDNKRNTFNPEDKYLEASDSDAEATFTFCDFLSNGFKAKTTGAGFNASGGTYIYMAFAEEPLVASNDIPATAR